MIPFLLLIVMVPRIYHLVKYFPNYKSGKGYEIKVPDAVVRTAYVFELIAVIVLFIIGMMI